MDRKGLALKNSKKEVSQPIPLSSDDLQQLDTVLEDVGTTTELEDWQKKLLSTIQQQENQYLQNETELLQNSQICATDEKSMVKALYEHLVSKKVSESFDSDWCSSTLLDNEATNGSIPSLSSKRQKLDSSEYNNQ